ncbi:MAG: hypothetical protein H5T69_01655 [Chloroflexi bacterium]|nr:hypothetical protein [Chloroflexota bacterium]
MGWPARGGRTAADGRLGVAVAVPERGVPAGNGGDARGNTYAFSAANQALQLVRLDASPIDRAAVPALYGSPDGMTIYDGGKNVAAANYGAFSGPLQPIGQDLSTAAGWPQVAVAPGRVAIDPLLGRFAFYTGGPPYRVGRWGADAHDGVYVQGDYAYVSDWVRGLDIVDIRDPAHPTLVANLPLVAQGAVDVVVDGRYAYVSMKWHGLRVIDVLDPAHPLEVAWVREHVNQLSLHLVKVGDYVYMAAEGDGVLIYNVSTPTNPRYVGRCHNGQNAESVFVKGRYAYVAVGNNGLSIYNISNPAAPFYVGGLDGLGYCFDVHVSGGYAYLATFNALQVVHLSTPSKPTLVNTVNTIGQAYDVQVTSGYAFVGERGSTGYVQIYDLGDPTEPLLAKTYAILNTGPNGVTGLHAINGLVYTAANAKGLVIFNPNLSEAPRGPVTVDYNWADDVEPPTPTPTLDPSTTMTLTLHVERQGRGAAPSARWAEPVWIEVAAPGGGARYGYQALCDAMGQATVPGVPQGVYDVRVRGRTSLYNQLSAQTLAPDGPPLDMGLLAEGDANLDGRIDVFDFSLLASSYGLAEGQPGYDPRADFDGDGAIQLYDFSLLASNYGLVGPLDATQR